MTSCPFCDIVHGTGPVSLVYEDDLTMAFIPLQPIYPGACIVIPKVHIDHFTDLPDELAVRIMVVSQRIGRKNHGSLPTLESRYGSSWLWGSPCSHEPDSPT